MVGEVFKTYIITEREGELCLIDKHAAHERILFEKLSKDYGNVPAQMLLVPVQVNLTAAEKQAVLQNLSCSTMRVWKWMILVVPPCWCAQSLPMWKWTMWKTWWWNWLII